MSKNTIIIGDRSITIHRMTLAMKLRESELVLNASENPVEDKYQQVVRLVFYPAMVACSTGDVPNEDEFQNMPVGDIEKWYELVFELNPSILESKDTKQDKKK